MREGPDHGGSRRRARRPALVALVALVAGLGASCGSDPEVVPAPEPPELSLDFDDVPEEILNGNEIAQSGSAALSAVLLTRRESREAPQVVTVVPDRTGGQALRLPKVTPGAQVDGPVLQPLGVLMVSPLSLASPHPLDPGDRDFSFGASFWLDKVSGGTAVDGGNNLVGRGSFDDPAQYKVQLDERLPSCRIQGREGTVLVKASIEVEPSTWYDVACSRTTAGVELMLTRHDGDATTSRTWAEEGPTGDFGGLDPAVSLAIGGKLTPSGGLVRSETDQFNGVVDNVFLDVED